MMAINTPQASNSLSMLLKGIADVGVSEDREITGVKLDSRKVTSGDLFIACQGVSVNGCDYIEAAIAAGAVAVVWESIPKVYPLQIARIHDADSGVPVIAAENLKEQVGVIASRFYGHPSRKMNVIGVTGTNGKTSCSHFLSQVLNKESSCGLIGTLGYGLYGDLKETNMTTPDPVSLQSFLKELLDSGAENVVMEVSSHGLDQGRVGGTDVNIAVFTNLSRDHLDYHHDMDAYGQSKQKLFELPGIKTVVINADDEFGRALIAGVSDEKECVSYGMRTHEYQPAVYATDICLDHNGVNFKVTTPWGNGRLQSSLMGRFNVSNLLAVLSTMLVMGVSLKDALEQLSRLDTVPGRMERLDGGSDLPLVVIDYAHTPDALKQALMALRDHGGDKLICVFGCGGDRDRGKRPLMGGIAVEHADVVVITDDNPRSESPAQIVDDIMQGIGAAGTVSVVHDRARAIHQAIAGAGAEDIVLIAGKGHESYQLIGKNKIPFSDLNQVDTILQSLK